MQMELIKASLCPHCTECPEVEITDRGVSIGEDANTACLSHAEWNVLVGIKRGELGEIEER
jgi:sarcosine oxidase delta subunit